MISLKTIQNCRRLLTSSQLTLRGDQLLAVAEAVGELTQAELVLSRPVSVETRSDATNPGVAAVESCSGAEPTE